MELSTATTKPPHFRLAGIPVRVEPVFFVIIGFLGLGQPSATYIASWIAIATVSILVHEMGHAAAFRFYGLRPRVTLHGLGGLTTATAGPSAEIDSFGPGKRIVSSLAGPLAALFLLGLPSLVLALANGFDPWAAISYRRFAFTLPPAEILLSQVIWINVGWSLLNLLPVLPLDGGNVMLSIVEMVVSRGARRITNIISVVIGIAIGIWSIAVGYEFGLILVGMFVVMNVMALIRSKRDDLADELADAQRALVDYRPGDAERIARSVLARNPQGENRRWGVELLAWARLASGDLPQAVEITWSLPPSEPPSASLRGALALVSGNIAEGVSVIAWALVNDRHRPAKVLAVMAAAQAGQAVAVARELLLLGPEGVRAAQLLQGLLDYVGHRTEAAEVARVVAAAVPVPPGW